MIRWFIQNYSLSDMLGVDVEGKKVIFAHSTPIITRPWVSCTIQEKAYVRPMLYPGLPAHSPPDAVRPWDAFNVYMHVNGLDFEEAVRRVVQDNGIGRKRELQVEEAKANPAPERTLDAHLADLAQSRADLETETAIAATRRGRATVIRTEPGVGKTSAAIRRANTDHAAERRSTSSHPTTNMPSVSGRTNSRTPTSGSRVASSVSALHPPSSKRGVSWAMPRHTARRLTAPIRCNAPRPTASKSSSNIPT